jgi:signal transduction histidine kinase
MKRRLLVSNLALVTTVLLLLEVPLGLIYARHEHDTLDSSLQRDAASLSALSEEVIEQPGDHDVGGLAQRFTSGAGGAVIIIDRHGRIVSSTMPAALAADFAGVYQAAQAGHTAAGEAGGLTYAAVPVGSASTHGAVVVARSDSDTDHRIKLFWLALLGIGAGVLVTSVVVSNRLARWAVGPLQRLDSQAARLGRGDLDARADAVDGPREVVALATTFNDMATRLDDLVSSQRRFVADASHQLRTPLTALRLRLENLDTHDPAAVATARDAALVESARLTRLVDGLLALARAENARVIREPVDVTAVIVQRHEAWAPLAAEHNIALRVVGDAGPAVATIVPGHPEQILDNLIDNALDATPDGGTVELRAASTASGVEIHVADEGRGMTDEERQRAFDPFWQSPNSQSNGSSGLGLAIVEQLVHASSGTVALERSATGGVDAVVRFPSQR